MRRGIAYALCFRAASIILIAVGPSQPSARMIVYAIDVPRWWSCGSEIRSECGDGQRGQRNSTAVWNRATGFRSWPSS